MSRPRRGHVLILDDDRTVCQFLERALVEIGVAVTVCHSPDGIGEVQQSGVQFNLIVTNVTRLDRPTFPSVTELEIVFPGVPVLHVEEVIPFSIWGFQDAARKRMRKKERTI
jgi:hypothetical protein